MSSLLSEFDLAPPEPSQPPTKPNRKPSAKADKATQMVATDPESSLFDPLLFHPDIRPIRDAARAPLVGLDPNNFSEQVLSQRPGMEWISYCQFNLLPAPSKDVEDQRQALREWAVQFVEKASLKITKADFPDHLHENDDLPVIALDTETTGLDTRTRYNYDGFIDPFVDIAGICLCSELDIGWYLPILHTEEDGFLNWDKSVVIETVSLIIQSCYLVYHNAQYDKEVLALHGANLRGFPYYADTQSLDYLLDVNEKRHGLKDCSARHLKRHMVEIEELFGGKKTAEVITFDRIPASVARVYACSDATNTLRLFDFYRNHSNNPMAKQPVPFAIDMQLIDVLRAAYRHGLPTNPRFNFYGALDCLQNIQLVKKTIDDFCGEELAIGSPKEVARIIYDVFNIPPLEGQEKMKSGVYSTDEDTLDALLEENPDFTILRLIVLYRKLNNALVKVHTKSLTNLYTDALIPYARLGISFSVTNVPTGRMSSMSGKGAERITVNKTKTGLSMAYHAGAGDCGFNTQGVMTLPQLFQDASTITTQPTTIKKWFDSLGHQPKDFSDENSEYLLYAQRDYNELAIQLAKKS